MKNLFRSLLACTLLFSIAACNKNEGLILPHDQNEMMSLMHQMMNKMDSMQFSKDGDHRNIGLAYRK